METMQIKELESKSLLAAIFYFEKDELSTAEHDIIKSQLQKSISRTNIAILNEVGKQINGDMHYQSNSAFFNEVQQKNISSFVTDKYFYNGIYYKDNEGNFVVITRHLKADFNAQMNALLKILGLVSFIALIFILGFSQLLSYLAYQPILSIVSQIKDRDTHNFNEPLHLQKSYSEIEDLLATYNELMAQISKNFDIQKNFIDYVSHELRTPLTAIFGTLEVTQRKERNLEEYAQVLTQLTQYTNDLEKTLDQMMLLSGAKTSFELKPVRIDEIIWKVVENTMIYHQADIRVDINVENHQLLTLKGNEQLLELAIGNIITNALKYSDNKLVQINFAERDNQLSIAIIDEGIGIADEDIERIKQNFFRGQNALKYPGKGIGLSISSIIFNLHQITLEVTNNPTGGTIANLNFQKSM